MAQRITDNNIHTKGGTVEFVAGSVKIVGTDGIERVAQVGDKLMSKDTIVTRADGTIELRLANGELAQIDREAKLVIDTPEQPAVLGTEVAELQAAIASGQNPALLRSRREFEPRPTDCFRRKCISCRHQTDDQGAEFPPTN